MIRQVEYFDQPGRKNTDACIAIVKKMIEEEGFEHVVAASTTGDVGRNIYRALLNTDVNLVVVTHSAGFKQPNEQEFDSEIREELEQGGPRVLTTTVLTHSLETSLAAKYQGVYPTQLIANSLRRWGEGSKVCCEIVMEAVDAGLIPEGEHVIAVGGTGHGADTVAVMKSAASKRFLGLVFSEYRAKPR